MRLLAIVLFCDAREAIGGRPDSFGAIARFQLGKSMHLSCSILFWKLAITNRGEDSMAARQVILFLNRAAGTGARRRHVDSMIKRLEGSGFVVEVIATIEGLQQRVVRVDEIDCVISAGGDGTVETVVNSVAADVPIAVFPLGTENLLAKYLKIDADPNRFVEMVKRGRTVQMDAGRANGKQFLVMLSCGFDAEVVRRVHAERQGNITHLAYAKPMVESIWSYNYPNLKVSWETDSGWQQIDCHWAFIFNAPIYAAGLQIVSDGNPSDGVFEIATFAGGSFWHALRQFGAVALGQHQQQPDYQLNWGAKVRIESDQLEVPYQIDGDPGGFLPVDIEVLPKRLTLIVDESRHHC